MHTTHNGLPGESLDTEGSYNGNNPNGWGWTDTSFVYRSNGDIVATVIAEISEEYESEGTGSFMGVYNVTGPITHVFNSIIRKLDEYGY